MTRTLQKKENLSKLLAGPTEELKKLRAHKKDNRRRLGITTESLRLLKESETKLKTVG